MVAQSSSPTSVKEQLQASATQLWSSMQKQWPSDKPNNDTGEEGAQVSLESVIRVMFGSCTAGISPNDYEPKGAAKCGQSPTSEPVSPTTKSEERKRYKNIFKDDHKKAEDAICHLREQMEQKSHHRPSPPRNIMTQNSKGTPKRQRGKSSNVPTIFSASTPKEKSKVDTAALSPETEVTDLTTTPSTDDLVDDEISAISQHTLEELARLHQGDNAFLERVHSDVTQDPVESTEETWKHTANPNNRGASKSPLRIGSPHRLTRNGRSHGTLNTKHTMNTKSTMSTQTNEFANLFKQEEQRYWQELVKEQHGNDDPATQSGSFRKSSRVRSNSGRGKVCFSRESYISETLPSRISLTNPSLLLFRVISLQSFNRDGTITTVSSSVYSKSGRSRRSTSNLENDPDRMMDVIVVPPGTEIGEI